MVFIIINLIILTMNLSNPHNLDTETLLSQFNVKNLKAQIQKTIFGKKNIIVHLYDRKFVLNIKKDGAIKFNILIPIWWNLAAFFLGIILFSLAFKVLSGDIVNLKCVVLTILIILIVADFLYKTINNDRIKKASQDLRDILSNKPLSSW